ncbi:asparagine--tRNA ligase [Sarracenia purpurea var. burkii]
MAMSIPLYRSSLNVNEIEVTVDEKLKEESLEVEDKDAPSSLMVRSSPVSKAESEYEEEADDGELECLPTMVAGVWSEDKQPTARSNNPILKAAFNSACVLRSVLNAYGTLVYLIFWCLVFSSDGRELELVVVRGEKAKSWFSCLVWVVARVRNALAYATHKFFQDNGFVWISNPIITASDYEGAGGQFCVTTLGEGIAHSLFMKSIEVVDKLLK